MTGRPRFETAVAIIRAAVEQGDIPGAVLQVRIDGRVVHESAIGRRRIDSDERMTREDLFPVASLTKPIVAAAILQLCEAGKLGLDDPVATYLPEFADARVLIRYDMTTGDVHSRPAQGVMTIRRLLTHTSGIHDGFVTSDLVMGTLYERAGVVYDDTLLLEDKIRRLGPLPLAHDPGTAWTYGLSSDVAGRLLEVAAGEPLDRYLFHHIFAPLGMLSTYFFIPAAEHRQRVGRHVRANGHVALAPWELTDETGARYLSGGGGLHTTAADYGRFVQALLDSGRPILSRASVDAMTSNQIGDLSALGLRYGLSVGVATADAPGRTSLPIGGFGWYGIYSTWFWTIHRRQGAVLFLSNVLDAEMNLPLFSRVVRAVEEAR